MKKGETIELVLNYTVGGEPIGEGDFDEIKLKVGDVTLSRNNGQLKWDDEIERYVGVLSSNDTRYMPDIAKTQLEINVSGYTYLSNVGKLGFARSII